MRERFRARRNDKSRALRIKPSCENQSTLIEVTIHSIWARFQKKEKKKKKKKNQWAGFKRLWARFQVDEVTEQFELISAKCLDKVINHLFVDEYIL